MGTSTISPAQAWDSTENHAPPAQQWDSTENHVVPAQDDSNPVSRFISGLGATSSKIAHNLDPTPVLEKIGEADNLAGQGRWADAWSTLRDLVPGASPSQQVLGNQKGTTLAEQRAYVEDTLRKFKAGDYSGGAANVATAALANAHNVPENVRSGVSDAAARAADATVNAAKPYIAGAKAAAPPIIESLPVVGKVFTGAQKAKVAYQTAKQAVEAVRAQQQSDTATAAPSAPGPQPTSTAPSAPPSPADIAALRAKVEARLQQNKAANAPAAPEAAPVAPEEDPALLDGIARSQAGRPFAKLNPQAQAIVRAMAKRGTQSVPPPAQTTPPASPPVPAAAAPPPASTPLASAPSQTAAAQPPAPGSSALPPAASVPVPQPTSVRGAPIVAPTSLYELLKNPEYYPLSTAEHIPTPAELGHGVYGESLPESSSVLGHIKAENEKAFNAADYAFRNGITDPEVLDKMDAEQSKAFVDEALDHGRKVGNPTPKTKYKTGLDGHTLVLAKAHLAKLVADAESQPVALADAQSQPQLAQQ